HWGADLLRRLGTPTFVAVNKVDHAKREAEAWEFVGLGLGDPWPVSALHGLGTGDLLDAVLSAFPPDGQPLGPPVGGRPDGPAGTDAAEAGGEVGDTGGVAGTDERTLFGVAIVGRPNVGKSTLFNRLIGEDRSVVHDLPGTTRDVVDTVVETAFGPVRFLDTAGLRRRSRIDEGTEYFSMVRALRAIDKADVALLVIDVTQGVTHQDQRLAERVDAAGCPVVIVLNKWELLDAEARLDVTAQVRDRLRFVGTAPVLKLSALTGKGVHKLLPSLGETISDYHARVPTAKVNRIIRDAQASQPAPHGARVLYATQGASEPPTFTLFTNRELPQTYLRYLERKLREGCDLGSVPLKLRVRRRS
ncbi:MAG: ribosome biogenesis GTPase Der, partial [Acidimicrobiia bacterium]|nr:ribosome biogenesis GTPase Der [Acidimicrobiia bacterium]